MASPSASCRLFVGNDDGALDAEPERDVIGRSCDRQVPDDGRESAQARPRPIDGGNELRVVRCQS